MPHIDFLFLFRSEPGRFTLKNEREVIAMAVNGATASEIAAKFKTPVKTIERKARPISIRKAAVRKSSRSGKTLALSLSSTFRGPRNRKGSWEMTLEDAVAVWLYFLNEDTIGESEEQILDTAWEIIARQAKKAIRSFSENGLGRQSPDDKPGD